MARSSLLPFLRVPPLIHTEDPGSPPPESILLDRYGYLSCRLNGTTADGFTADGKRIQVTFWAASPPRVSCFTVHCPDVKPSAFDWLPTVIYSEDDLVLLRIPILRQDDSLDAESCHYFVYQAGTENNRPSLTMLPIPCDFTFSYDELVLLRCRDQDMFYFALLHRIIDPKNNGKRFDLHLYNSKTGTWNTENQFVDSVNYLNYSYPNIAVTIGGEFGSVGWVDLWRGMLICDLLRDNHSLRYIPLPLPLVPKLLKGYPMYFRDIVVVGDCIKYFEMSYDVRPGSGLTSATQDLVAATKKMKISDIGSGNNWEEDCTFKFSDIPVDSPKFARMLMLPNLKQVKNTKLTLMRLCAGYPALSLHDADVVYIMHTPDPDEDKALVIALDMRKKTLKDVADFGSGRPLGYTFTYLKSGISKHLNIWSSSRSGRNAGETSRDGCLGPCKLEVLEVNAEPQPTAT
ncbi:hypothetical protein SEVIR_6G050100v4 [Setaria viridis]|uniref:DUF1618 domain-containing protein n=1 Tax=Setaria viridis TaxID=4556 RepID=A0A4U6U614_SETVI|nr:uncharacterized protein LOC117860773 [Setaria viridis]TKW08819.1 hypothetical protein SEVIR_6G050100v2 [Setaria viridis]